MYSDYALIKKSTLTEIGDAIRTVKGTTDLIDPTIFATEILSLGGNNSITEPVWIINPEGTTWDTMYLQTDGTPQSGSFRISGDGADFSFMSNYSEDVINTWVYKLVYGNDYIGSMVFTSPIDCYNYSKLRIKYYVSLRGVYDTAYANVMLIKDINTDSNTIGETYSITDLKTAYAEAINGNGIPSYNSNVLQLIGQNADDEAWKYVDIDVSDIDEFYLGFRVMGISLHIISIQLTNE